jgi:hypothetical protein
MINLIIFITHYEYCYFFIYLVKLEVDPSLFKKRNLHFLGTEGVTLSICLQHRTR